MNRFSDRRIWLKKSERITDFCDKLNGLADFENRADHGSAGNFGVDFGLCEGRIVDPQLRSSEIANLTILSTSISLPMNVYTTLSSKPVKIRN